MFRGGLMLVAVCLCLLYRPPPVMADGISIPLFKSKAKKTAEPKQAVAPPVQPRGVGPVAKPVSAAKPRTLTVVAAKTTLTSTLNLTAADNGRTFENYRISSQNGPCVTANGAVGVTFHNSEIGPCGAAEHCQGNGQGIWLNNGSNDMKILDTWIHPECGANNNATADSGDNVLCQNSSGLLIQGSVLSHGKGGNFFGYPNCPHATLRGNFLLNPDNGSGNRGGVAQFLDGSNYGTVDQNYVLASTDPKYGWPANTGDIINFGSISGNPPNNFGAVVTKNYVQGGTWQYGCAINLEGGMSYASDSPRSTVADNVVVDSGTCGISIESGFNYDITNNKVFSRNTIPFANGNAYQAFQCYGGMGSACYNGEILPCGNINYTGNLGYGVGNTGVVSGIYLAGDWPCRNIVMGAGNIFDNGPNQAAYNTMLPLLSTSMAPPAIPPVPFSCVVASPWTNNTKMAMCDGITPPPPPPPVTKCEGLKAMWAFMNPAGGTCVLDGTRVVLTAPGGSNHDPQFGGMDNSVRIMQKIGMADFQVQAKFDSVPSKSYQFEGIIVEQDSANYLRMQFGYNGTALIVNADTIIGSTNSTTLYNKPITGGATRLWMRVAKTGTTVTQSWSKDGTNWQAAGTFETSMIPGWIGPYAANYSEPPASAPEFVGRVDYFNNIPALSAKGLPVSDGFNK